MKIDLNSKINIKFDASNSSYHAAQSRFNEILEKKLGVTKTQRVVGGAIPSTRPSSDLRAPSGITAADIDARLKGTVMEGLGQAFLDAEEKHGVNAVFLTSLAVHESAYGSSPIARDKNNLFGFGAYDATPYASAYRFDDFQSGIDHVAAYLSENYLKEGGRYFNGYTIQDVGKRYATDPNWAAGIERIMTAFNQTRK